jgi:hypothetical protein
LDKQEDDWTSKKTIGQTRRRLDKQEDDWTNKKGLGQARRRLGRQKAMGQTKRRLIWEAETGGFPSGEL